MIYSYGGAYIGYATREGDSAIMAVSGIDAFFDGEEYVAVVIARDSYVNLRNGLVTIVGERDQAVVFR